MKQWAVYLYSINLNKAIMEEKPESCRNRNKGLFNFILNDTPNYAFHSGATASVVILPKLRPCGVREVAQTESEWKNK